MNALIRLLVVVCAILANPGMAQVVPMLGANTEVTPTHNFDSTIATTALDVPGPLKTYAVAWVESGLVMVKIIAESGNEVAPTTVVSTRPPGGGGSAVVSLGIAANGEGRFAVVYTYRTETFGLPFGRTEHEVFYRLYNPRAKTDGSGQLVVDDLSAQETLFDPDEFFGGDYSTTDLADPGKLDVAASFSGRFVLAYADFRNRNVVEDYSIHTMFYDLEVTTNAGVETGLLVPLPTQSMPTLITNVGEYGVQPRIDINSNNESAVVVYRTSEGAIKGQALRPNGSLDGPAFDLVVPRSDAVITYHDPDVSIALDDSLHVVWEVNDQGMDNSVVSENSIAKAVYSAAGALLTGPTIVSTGPQPSVATALVPRRSPRVQARATDGSSSVVWRQDAAECSGLPSIGIRTDCDLPIEPSERTCRFYITGVSGTVGTCRESWRLVDASSLDWVRPSPDEARDLYPGSLREIFLDIDSINATRDRCFTISYTSAWRTISRTITQRCNFPGCQSCEPSSVATSSDKDFPTLEYAVLPAAQSAKGSDGFNVWMRWLQSGFQQPGATFVDQFQVNAGPIPSTDIQSVEIAQSRNGDMLAIWGESDLGSVYAQRMESAVELSINDVGILEGPFEATASFTVTANKPYPADPGQTAAVPAISLLTSDDTASFLSDYERTESGLAFPPGAPLAQSVDVLVYDDTIYEDNETFFMDMFDEANAIVVKRDGLGVIVDNDSPAAVSVADATVCENGETDISSCSGTYLPVPPNSNPVVRLQVTLPVAQEVDGSVEFRTLDGVSTSTVKGAIAGRDYESVTGELQFLAGSTTGFIAIEILDNPVSELDKVFRVELTETSDLTLGDSIAEVRLVNDDACSDIPVVRIPQGMDSDRLIDIVAEGGSSYLCVSNPVPADCSWSSTLSFQPGEPVDWLTAQDFPGQTAPSEAGCLANATGYIKLDATPNLPPQVLAKVFAAPAAPGSTVELQFVVQNLYDSAITQLGFSDDLGAMLSGAQASVLPANGFCGASSQISGSGVLTVTGIDLQPQEQCAFSVTVQVPAAANPGSYENVTSNASGLRDGEAMTEPPAMAVLEVIPAGAAGMTSGAINGVGQTSRTATLQISGATHADGIPATGPAEFSVAQQGGVCDPMISESMFSFFPGGGVGSFDVELVSPEGSAAACDNVPYTLSITSGGESWIGNLRINGQPALFGVGPGTVSFEVQATTLAYTLAEPGRSSSIQVNGVAVEIFQEGLFHDPFADATRPLGWDYADSAWSEQGEHFTVIAAGVEAAIATPAFPGCRLCVVETSMRQDTFSKGRGLLYAWYVDSDNYVAVQMDEFLDRWTLIQRLNGVDTVIRSWTRNLLTGTSYPVVLAYDGNDQNVVTLRANGEFLCPPTASGSTPCDLDPAALTLGTVGLAGDSGRYSFDLIKVTRADGPPYPDELPPGPLLIDGFEGP